MKDIHFSVEEISKIVNGDIIGNKNIYINNLATIENAKNGDLSVVHTDAYLKYIKLIINIKKIANRKSVLFLLNFLI